ncbi:UvrD-helicase domain-containing protein [uncultured Methanobrevibacter sp.]|uniref:UvrD-helicase domain-containing protein n=1 Tax=uncultured Methanobrevibacter sp. TaxID=253161 RepID=UPI0025DAE77E|nr:UvrD-helicase domain-containing protein [uncultured Methanobrevibacter sp.]
MPSKICPNCYFKNESDSIYCNECGSILDLSKYIESKQLEKNFLDKFKSAFGNKRIDEINSEIDSFIRLSLNFSNYDEDLIKFKSNKMDAEIFESKYNEISKLNYYEYLDEINKDDDLNKKVLKLKEIKTFMDNFDSNVEKQNNLLNKINLKLNDINQFNNNLDNLLNSDELLDTKNKNDLIQKYKSTFDFYDRSKVKKLDIESKNTINKFIDSYNNLDSTFKNHNKKINVKLHKQKILDNIKLIDNYFEKLDEFKSSNEFISITDKKSISDEFNTIYEMFDEEDLSQYSSKEQSKISQFLDSFSNLDNIINDINEKVGIKRLEEKINSKKELVDNFGKDISSLVELNSYITYKQIKEIKNKYLDLYDLINDAKHKIELKKEFSNFIKKYENIATIIGKINDHYIKNELEIHKSFFDNIDGKSLDYNQRLAVVSDEINSQIIAGAGCGKTLTVNAKVRYLIEKKGVNPSEILCLSFSNASVQDLQEKLPEDIEIYTFHKLGGKILEENDKPSRPDSEALQNFIKVYFRDNVINNEKLCEDIFEFYSYYFYNNVEEDDVDSIGEIYDIDKSRDYTTLKALYGGDNEKITFDNKTVKSFEELLIANYLFAHQIEYEYEKDYETVNKYYLEQKEFVFNLIFGEIDEINDIYIFDKLNIDLENLFEVKEIYTEKYKPDFYLPENEIYLEHFGVNRNCHALWLDKLGCEKYKQGIEWKRELHEKYGSKLIETYSYYMSENRLLLRLEEKLKKEGVEIKEIDYGYLISKIVERDQVNRFKEFMKLIQSFIELFKGNDYQIDKFSEFRKSVDLIEDEFNKKRNSLFLNIVEDIYISYQNYLKESKKIDFNDMINHATEEVKQGNLNDNYKYILVDEYQDTSYTRYNLVKSIQENTGAHVCVVGDDWQSIYRFTGCDVSLFSKFEDYFEYPLKLKIETTYRNSQELIDISGKFIKKNPNQIQKTLKSKKKSTNKPVKIAYYNNKSSQDKINIMEQVVDRIAKTSDRIMILGRNNFDIDEYIQTPGDEFKKPFIMSNKENELIYEKNKDLHVEYITVHRSKGLEEDNVILINLENKINGFPNKISDDPIMDFVINDSDQYEFGEERRLFYVALTRTKNNVYLLVPNNDKSQFVEELENDINKLEILSNNSEETFDNPEEFMKDKKAHTLKTHLKCPLCKTGNIELIILNKGEKNLFKFFSCSHERCDWDGGLYFSDLKLLNEIKICSECNSILQVYNGRYGPYYRCKNKCKTPKIKGELLNRIEKIFEENESNVEYESHESKIKCPKCKTGNITLNINPDNKYKHLKCSNKNCDWKVNNININKSQINEIQLCPECNSVLLKRKGKRGEFYGCSNFPKCRYTQEIGSSNNQQKESEKIKTSLKCPSCNSGDVLIEITGKDRGKFICSECSWDGGLFYENIDKINTLDYCPADDCNGITYMKKGKFGEFRSCSNYFKTKCNGKASKTKTNKPIKSKSSKTKTNKSTIKEIETDLECPECDGDVVLIKNTQTNKGFFTCSNVDCDWNGGPFNQDEELLDTLDYCQEPGCDGLTYEKEGKYGTFKVCTYFSKTGCKAGNEPKKESKYEKIETGLSCPDCLTGEIIFINNKETGRGFLRCDNCDYDGGFFNEDDDLDSLEHCLEPGCGGLNYEKEGEYGTFTACTYYSKNGCKPGKN